VVITGRRPEPLKALTESRDNLDSFLRMQRILKTPRAVGTVTERWRRLDVLVNNTGAGAILPLEVSIAMAIPRSFAVNVFGPPLLATTALPYLKASGGNIVKVSSTFGQKAATRRPTPGWVLSRRTSSRPWPASSRARLSSSIDAIQRFNQYSHSLRHRATKGSRAFYIGSVDSTSLKIPA
jgi:NAD(P)-dependent dehydrogenase (short-subunit alcohol dehydrogenase family)